VGLTGLRIRGFTGASFVGANLPYTINPTCPFAALPMAS
jgi:hypothetical protein